MSNSEEPKKVSLNYSPKNGEEKNAIVSKDGFPAGHAYDGKSFESPVDPNKYVKGQVEKPKKV